MNTTLMSTNPFFASTGTTDIQNVGRGTYDPNGTPIELKGDSSPQESRAPLSGEVKLK